MFIVNDLVLDEVFLDLRSQKGQFIVDIKLKNHKKLGVLVFRYKIQKNKKQEQSVPVDMP